MVLMHVFLQDPLGIFLASICMSTVYPSTEARCSFHPRHLSDLSQPSRHPPYGETCLCFLFCLRLTKFTLYMLTSYKITISHQLFLLNGEEHGVEA